MSNLPSSSNPNYSNATETALDRIRASYLNEGAEERLTDDDKKRKEQLEAAHGLLVNYHSMEQAVPLLTGRFDISRATAYRRCTEAIRLFGDVTRSYKDGIRHILYEFAMKVFQLAATAKPPDLKAMNASIKNMAILKGLDKDDSNALTPEVLANRSYVLNITLAGSDGQTKTIDLGNLNKIDGETYAQVVEAVEQSDVGLEEMRGLLLEAQDGEEGDDDE
ncbi:hypothetical protein SAMN02746009_02450 [Hymenobacter psychrotolerans DSM 18569]|uniref:Uncharacterized protein n=1 Tax=Hymenobacter psychrotolerans DSM 18569 TaxID=1121959 RepID=A0A1M6Z7X1_9BACT|nr:hypothetical protein SAMN02746009_02450 [Hymenobacter psychrotolerans DSM 18569]